MAKVSFQLSANIICFCPFLFLPLFIMVNYCVCTGCANTNLSGHCILHCNISNIKWCTCVWCPFQTEVLSFCLYKLPMTSKGSGNLCSLPLSEIQLLSAAKCICVSWSCHNFSLAPLPWFCPYSLWYCQMSFSRVTPSLFFTVQTNSCAWGSPVKETDVLQSVQVSAHEILLSLSHSREKVEWGKPWTGECKNYCPGQNNQDPIHQEDGSCRWVVEWIPQAAETR